jgi:hypothetical protein
MVFLTTEEVILKVREVAKACGWAIGVHGSLVRDIDLIGVPWLEDAKTSHEFYLALREHFDGANIVPGKPHGRWGCILFQKGAVSVYSKRENGIYDWIPAAIDLSFVDIRSCHA